MFNILFLNVSCIFLMMLTGWIAVKKNQISRSTVSEISKILVNFFYPCLIFHAIATSFSFDELLSSWTLPVSCFGLMFLGYIIGSITATFIRFKSADEETGFLFQSTMNNYSFLPLPLVMILYGEKGAAALIFSSFGAELAIWTLGIFILKGRKIDWKNLSHLLSLPLLSLYLSIVFLFILWKFDLNIESMMHPQHPLRYIFKAVEMVGRATIPVAMLVAGARIASINFSGLACRKVWILSFLRLVLIPAIAISIVLILPLPLITKQIIIIVATMPVAIASIILSEIYGLENSFISITVLSTHLASIITIPIILGLVLRWL